MANTNTNPKTFKDVDLTKDERAWLLAKVAALPGEPVRETIIRAQAIKETL